MKLAVPQLTATAFLKFRVEFRATTGFWGLQGGGNYSKGLCIKSP